MRFTDHTARRAAEQIAEGVPLADIDKTERDSLEALLQQVRWDEEYRAVDERQLPLMTGE